MEFLNKTLIIRAFFVLILLWIIGQSLAPILSRLLTTLLYPNKRSDKNVDIDILIARKKRILGRQNGANSSSKESSESNLSYYKQNNPKLYEELKTILDALTWGSHPFTTSIKKFLFKNYQIEYSENAITGHLHKILKHKEFAKRNLNDFKTLSALSVLIEVLELQSVNRRGQQLEILSNRIHLRPLDLALGFESFILELKKMPLEQRLDLLLKEKSLTQSVIPNNIEDLTSRYILSLNDQENLNISLFLDQLQIHSELICSLSPVPSLNDPQSLKEASEALGVSPKIPYEMLKNFYKKQARLRHPDRITARKLPKKYEVKAGENFVKMKAAYDTIMKLRNLK
ncbi:MAG: J domain-containing protein [Bacteriovoracaceae bacterium]